MARPWRAGRAIRGRSIRSGGGGLEGPLLSTSPVLGIRGLPWLSPFELKRTHQFPRPGRARPGLLIVQGGSGLPRCPRFWPTSEQIRSSASNLRCKKRGAHRSLVVDPLSSPSGVLSCTAIDARDVTDYGHWLLEGSSSSPDFQVLDLVSTSIEGMQFLVFHLSKLSLLDGNRVSACSWKCVVLNAELALPSNPRSRSFLCGLRNAGSANIGRLIHGAAWFVASIA